MMIKALIPKQTIKLLGFILVAFSLTTTGCFSEQIKEPDLQSKLFNKQWNIQTLNQKLETEKMFISFNKENKEIKEIKTIKISGFSGCNRFFGSVVVSATIPDNTMQFSPLAGTRKMCSKTMSFERKILSKLSTITSYNIEVKSTIETLYLYQDNTEVFSFTVKK